MRACMYVHFHEMHECVCVVGGRVFFRGVEELGGAPQHNKQTML